MNIFENKNLFPTVNASVSIYHNWIILHLFTMVAANNMTIISGLLDLLSLSGDEAGTQVVSKALE